MIKFKKNKLLCQYVLFNGDYGFMSCLVLLDGAGQRVRLVGGSREEGHQNGQGR